MRRVVVAVLLIEVGVALIVLPWSGFWEQNYFVQTFAVVGRVMTNHYVRGAVSGLGVVNVATAIGELAAMVFARRRPDDSVWPPHEEH